MGLKWLKTEGSRVCFLSKGLTRAVLSVSGKIPVPREQFTMSNTLWKKLSKTLSKEKVQKALRDQVENFSCVILFCFTNFRFPLEVPAGF